MANGFCVSREELKINYENALNNVANMLDRNGPVYATWIEFQMGLDSSNSVTFNSASTDMRENLIASLSVTKSGSGVANEFVLVVQYDPFNFGQNTDLRGNVEKLDSFIAEAMSEGFLSGTDQLRCKIQYGYNSFSSYLDDNLISPKYSLLLTGASSSVDCDSGLTTYTFTGMSELSVDCDFVTNFNGFENKNMLEEIGKILYTYYGDVSKKPSWITEDIQPMSGTTSYYIDISESDIEQAVDISVDASTAVQSPWSFCQSILEAHPLTKSEVDSNLYTDTGTDIISLNKRPRYSMYLTDVDGRETIHVVHINPSTITVNGKNDSADNLKINYVFSWGLKNEDLANKNIVTGWRPEVNLYTYLIRSANNIRYKKLQNLADFNPQYEKTLQQYSGYSSEVVEMYNAELELIGVPADPPFGAEVEVIPRILESFSRTSGVYIINGASDEINNNGVFKSKLKLVRKGSIDINKMESVT